MQYRRMSIEIESPEQIGYQNIECNLTESSVADARLDAFDFSGANLLLAYTDHRGKPELRECLADDSGDLKPEDVLITAGAAAALFIIATSLLEKGDRIVVAKPNYATNIETPVAIGADIVYLPLTFENRYRVDPKCLAELLTPNTRLISLTAPHNPTGTTMSADELRVIVDLVERNRCLLLLDETYREMAFGERLPVAATLSDQVISVSSLSKAYGLPGLRMGWIMCRNRALMETFLAAKEQIFICNSIVDEEIAWKVMIHKHAMLSRVRDQTAQNFSILKNWMTGQRYLEWIEPEGGVVCFPRFKVPERIDIDAFYRTLNQTYKTYVGPGHWFDEERRSMRIGYGWPTTAELECGLANVSLAAEASLLSQTDFDHPLID